MQINPEGTSEEVAERTRRRHLHLAYAVGIACFLVQALDRVGWVDWPTPMSLLLAVGMIVAFLFALKTHSEAPCECVDGCECDHDEDDPR